MSKLESAARAALGFVEFCWRDVSLNDYAEERRAEVEDALRAALAEPQPEPWEDDFDEARGGHRVTPQSEPVGYLCRHKTSVADAEKFMPGEPTGYLWQYTHGTQNLERFESYDHLEVMRVFAHPPRQPVPLTDREIIEATEDVFLSEKKGYDYDLAIARAVEAAVLKKQDGK